MTYLDIANVVILANEKSVFAQYVELAFSMWRYMHNSSTPPTKVFVSTFEIAFFLL